MGGKKGQALEFTSVVSLTEFVGCLPRSICLVKFFWKKVNFSYDLVEISFDVEGHFKGISLERCLEESQKQPASEVVLEGAE